MNSRRSCPGLPPAIGLGLIFLATGCALPRGVPAVRPDAFVTHVMTTMGPLEVRDTYFPGQGVVRRAVIPGERPVLAAPARRADGSEGYDLLALSGGGSNGAFGAGVLCGWTEAGSRPTFQIVTGVSTGSLLSSFAFAGPNFDDRMRQAFTTVETPSIYRRISVFRLPWSESLNSAEPLDRLIEHYADTTLLAAVAQGHHEGRRLYVGTTNLDQMRLIIWDMGALAACGHPGAPELYRRVVRASSSIPVLFDPVEFEVVANGRSLSEVHVDGGTRAQVFMRRILVQELSPALAGPREGEPRITLGDERTTSPRAIDGSGSRLHILVNGKLKPDPAPMKRGLAAIASQSVEALMSASFNGELYRMYLLTTTTGMEYRLLAIPQEFAQVPSPASFDSGTMTGLFESGRAMSLARAPWMTAPRGMEETETALLGPRRASRTLVPGDEVTIALETEPDDIERSGRVPAGLAWRRSSRPDVGRELVTRDVPRDDLRRVAADEFDIDDQRGTRPRLVRPTSGFDDETPAQNSPAIGSPR